MSKYEHRQSYFDLRKILIGFLYFSNNLPAKVCFSYDPNFLLLRISFLHCMDLQPYSHNHFSKVLRTFFASRNYSLVFLQRMLKRKITFHSHKHSFPPYPSLSPYRRTDRMTDRGTNTLTAHGLEEPRVNL